MSNKFKAIVLEQSGELFSREVKTLDKSFLNSGDVLAKVEYSNLNFKDAMILKNGGKLVKEYPRIPGIDFSGTVEESSVDDFKKGDQIIVNGARVGELYHGGYSQYAKVKKEFIIKKPNGISSRQAMILGTGGFTAVLCAFAIKAREELLLGEKVKDVLVTGATGGVGIVAVMALSKLGCNVTAVTGKMEQSNFLKELGAKNIINRKELETEPKLLGKGAWDGVVDTVGGNILANAISQTKHSGIVAACGNASGNKLNTSVIPFILRGIKLWGVDSVAVSKKRKEFVWGEMSKLIDFNLLEKSIKTTSLEELLNIFPKMLEGKLSNKVLIDVNK
ncbi:MAG: oxidoreductase [Candidatus Pelagibacterales bacterium]|nr:MAG: oxidoreductase [Pelagibacterales bacterium]